MHYRMYGLSYLRFVLEMLGWPDTCPERNVSPVILVRVALAFRMRHDF